MNRQRSIAYTNSSTRDDDDDNDAAAHGSSRGMMTMKEEEEDSSDEEEKDQASSSSEEEEEQQSICNGKIKDSCCHYAPSPLLSSSSSIIDRSKPVTPLAVAIMHYSTVLLRKVVTEWHELLR